MAKGSAASARQNFHGGMDFFMKLGVVQMTRSRSALRNDSSSAVPCAAICAVRFSGGMAVSARFEPNGLSSITRILFIGDSSRLDRSEFSILSKLSSEMPSQNITLSQHPRFSSLMKLTVSAGSFFSKKRDELLTAA